MRVLLLAALAAADPKGTCFTAQGQIVRLEAFLTKPYYKGHESESNKPIAECSTAVKAGLKEQERDVKRAESAWTRVKAQLQGLPPSEMVTAELAWGDAVVYVLQQDLQAALYFHGLPSSYDPDRTSGMLEQKRQDITTQKARYLATRR